MQSQAAGVGEEDLGGDEAADADADIAYAAQTMGPGAAEAGESEDGGGRAQDWVMDDQPHSPEHNVDQNA